MKLSKKSVYALKALACLGSPETPPLVTVPRGASIEGRGRSGDFDITDIGGGVVIASDNAGVRLNKIGGGAKVDVKRSDIVRAVDGPLAPLPCTNPIAPVKCADCVSLEHCWLRTVTTEVGAAVNAALDQITLVEICRRAAHSQRQRSAQVLMYEI